MPSRRKITGLVEQIENGKIVYWLDFSYRDDNGKLRRKRERIGTNKKEALYALSVRTAQKTQGEWWKIRKQEQILFRDFAEEFLEKHARLKRSYRRFQGIVKTLNQYFGDCLLHNVTAESIENFRRQRLDLGKAKATTNRELACLKTMYSKALLWDKTEKNPTAKVKLLQEENERIRYLSNDEQEKLILACKKSEAPHLYPIVMTALNTGMRLGEILNLRWCDIDLRNGFIHIEKSKSGKRRDVPMNNRLIEIFKYGIKKPNTEYVFCDDFGKSFTTIRRSFKTALKRAGISNFTFHSLRHDFACHALMAGGDIYTISKILGHSSVLVTQKYAHYIPSLAKKTVELLGRFHTMNDKTNDSLMTLEPKTEVVDRLENIKNILKNR
ncbi:MAG: site-specific integrase [bacterium]